MSTTVTANPIPPPQPKLVVFLELVALVSLGFLIFLAIKADKKLDNLEDNALQGREGI